MSIFIRCLWIFVLSFAYCTVVQDFCFDGKPWMESRECAIAVWSGVIYGMLTYILSGWAAFDIAYDDGYDSGYEDAQKDMEEGILDDEFKFNIKK